jgi:hypothetical protein
MRIVPFSGSGWVGVYADLQNIARTFSDFRTQFREIKMCAGTCRARRNSVWQLRNVGSWPEAAMTGGAEKGRF